MKKLFMIPLVALFVLPVMSQTYYGTDSNDDNCWLDISNISHEQFGGERMEADVNVSYTNVDFFGYSKLTFEGENLEPVVDKSIFEASYGNKSRMKSVTVEMNDNEEPLQFRYLDRKYSVLFGEIIKKDVMCFLD